MSDVPSAPDTPPAPWSPSPALKALLLLLVCLQGALCWAARDRSLQGRVDLRAFYSAGVLVRSGAMDRVYSDEAERQTQQAVFHDGGRTLHFLYPAFADVPCALLAAMPYRTAFLVVFLGNLLCLWLVARLLVREHPRWRLSTRFLFTCFLVFLPVAIALMQGQISFLLLLLFTLFYGLERRGRHCMAGVCLSLALVKFQIGLPVAFLYLLWRNYRVVLGFVAGGSALAAIHVALVGWQGAQAYTERIVGVGSSTLLHAAVAQAQFSMQTSREPNLHGLATLLAGTGVVGVMGTALLSLAVLLLAARSSASIATALPAALLLSYHLQPYDLVLLLLPLTLLVMQQLQQVRAAAPLPVFARWLLPACALLMTVPVAPLLVSRNATVWLLFASLGLLAATGTGESVRTWPMSELKAA